MRRVVVLVVLGGLLGGCPRGARIGGTREGDEVLRELRQENRELAEQVARLERDIALRVAEIDALEQQLSQGAALEPGERGKLPRFVAVRLDRYSGFLDTDGDGVDDTLRLYVHTLDQEGRFMPIAARAAVQVVSLEPGAAPRVLLERTFEPGEFEASYRSGFMGTHYTLEMALPGDVFAGVESATVTLAVTDLATGVTAKREASMRVR